ncbi:hypothetical protein MBANPS3_000284 [Mucor bainieri]
MKLRKRPQRLLVVIKKTDSINTTRQRLTIKKDVPRYQTASRDLRTSDVKKEEDDYKDALDTLRATSHDNGTNSASTIQTKTEIKQEDISKTSLHSGSEAATLPSQT